MGRRRRVSNVIKQVSNEIPDEVKWRLFVREMVKDGVFAKDIFKELCERGLTFDEAFRLVSEECGVGVSDLVRWSEEEGWMEEGGWLRRLEEGVGVIVEGRLIRRAMEGSVAAMKAYLVKWRPDEWSERLKVEGGGSGDVKVMVMLGYVPKDLEGRELPGVEVIDVGKEIVGGDARALPDSSEDGR